MKPQENKAKLAGKGVRGNRGVKERAKPKKVPHDIIVAFLKRCSLKQVS